MSGLTRAGATLLGAGAAGALLWVAAQIGRGTVGGYWGAYGVVAGAGVIFAASQVRGRAGHPPAMLGLSFVPVLIAAGWVLIAMQPHSNWFRSHVLAWSGDIGIRVVVLDVGTWAGVLAFAIGYTFGLALEPMPKRARAVESAATHEVPAADEPLTAERRDPREPVRTRPVV